MCLTSGLPFPVALSQLHANPLAETTPKIVFDRVGCEFQQFVASEGSFPMGGTALVRLIESSGHESVVSNSFREKNPPIVQSRELGCIDELLRVWLALRVPRICLFSEPFWWRISIHIRKATPT